MEGRREWRERETGRKKKEGGKAKEERTRKICGRERKREGEKDHSLGDTARVSESRN